MVQYNSLQNESLIARGAGTSEEPSMSHEALITALKEKSVEVNLFDEGDPDLSGVGPSLVYPSEGHLYPDLAELQGATFDDEGNEIPVMDYITQKCANIGDRDISIHPATTHLLFYDMKGSRRGGGQDLPWSEIDKLHAFLAAEGVSEGCLICNGDTTDLQSAQSAVSQSTPVITLKSVGGASEFLSQLFERRQKGGPMDTGRPVGFCKRFPEDAVPKEFRAGVFAPPDEATDEEVRPPIIRQLLVICRTFSDRLLVMPDDRDRHEQPGCWQGPSEADGEAPVVAGSFRGEDDWFACE